MNESDCYLSLMNERIKSITYEETWSIRHAVMWPNKPLDYVKLENDLEGIHFGMELDGEIVSVISAFIEGDVAQFRKFATKHEFQGRGYGSKLLTFLVKDLEKKGVKRIWCNARKDKVHFYERFGLQLTNKVFNRGGVSYMVMEKR